MKSKLSRVYLDDYPITLMGDEATPPLSRIVRAGGKRPDDVDVLFLTSPHDPKGHLVGPDEVIDRTAEPTRPIYLRSVAKQGSKPAAASPPALAPQSESMPSAPPTHAPLPWPNADRVIAQLGTDPVHKDHLPGMFRSPSQPAGDVVPTVVKAIKPSRQVKDAAAQAVAEAEAEQRQEDDRNQEDSLQDELEAQSESDEDEAQS